MMRRAVPAGHPRSGLVGLANATLLLLLAAVLAGACSPVGDPGLPPEPPGEEPEPEEPEEPEDPEAVPPLEEVPEPADPDAAVALLEDAEEALEADDPRRARDIALRVVEEHPDAPGSGGALWLVARASFEMGEYGPADQAALDYLDLLPEGHPDRGEANLLRADAGFRDGRTVDAVAILADLATEAPEDTRTAALERLRFQSQVLADAELDNVADLASGGAREVLRVERALRFHFDGDEDVARELAEAVLGGDPADEEARLAEAILEGRAEEVVGAAVELGALLPGDGPPSVMRTAEAVSEGLEVALEALEGRARRSLYIVTPQGDGDGSLGRERVRELEDAGVLALVGPLEGEALRRTAEARETPIPVLSLTAGFVPRELQREGVYALRTANPRAQADLARQARDDGHTTAVILRPREPRMREKADFFTETFEDEGGIVRAEVTYSPGQADLAGEMQEVKAWGADLLFLPIPSGEVETVATQIAFHQVAEDDDDEDYELALYGTQGWADEDVLQSVAPRHTEGVMVAVRAPAGGDPRGYEEFVEAYEEHFRQTFRSPDAALGWDAVGLLSEALDTGARSGPAVTTYLERIEGFEGATGTLSVRNGRIVTEHELARIENGRVRPLDGRSERP